MKLGAKIHTFVVVLLGITVFLAAIVVRNGIVGTLEDETSRRMKRGLKQCRLMADEWMERTYANARIAATGEDLKKAVEAGEIVEIIGVLSRVEKNLGIAAVGGIVSLKVPSIEEEIQFPAGSNKNLSEWHKMGLEGEYLQFFSEGPGVVAIVPVYPEGVATPSASLIISLPLSESFAESMADSTGALSVIYGNKMIKAMQVPAGTGIRTPLMTELDTLIKSNKNGVVEINGIPYLSGNISISGDKVQKAGTLFLAYPLSTVHQLAYMSVKRMILVLMSVLVLAFIASYLLTRHIVSPVSDLVTASKLLSEGKLDEEIQVRSSDEIGILSGTFEQMRLELKTMIEELRDRNRELEILNKISVEINRVEDSEKLLKLVIETAVEAVGAEKGSLMELDLESDELILKVVYAGGDSWTGMVKGQVELKAGQGIAGTVLSERTPVMTNDPISDPRFKKYGDSDKDSRVRSLICLPLMLGDEPVGVINIVNKREGLFTSSDLAFLRAFSSQVGVALHKARLYELAITDGLTRLYVRRYFMARLDEELSRARRYGQETALVLLDIDHFKGVNDNYGHQAGDKVLQEVSEAIKAELRRDLDLAGRYGGEEFALVLPRTDTRACMAVMERVRDAIANRVIKAGPELELQVTVSLGGAVYPEAGMERDSLIKQADEALYTSKETGRNKSTLAET